MCERHAPDEQPRLIVDLLQPKRLALPGPGSRRKRLWELPERLHCPVIGVCLSVEAIRRAVGDRRHSGGVPDDYDCHSLCVGAACRRTPISERLQAALERRHRLAIQRFKAVNHTEGVRALWRSATAGGDLAGALWAALTHPQTDAALEEAIYRDIHMLQHQAGASERVDRQAFDALGREHAALLREYGKVQSRMTAFATEKAAQIADLSQQLLQARGEAARQSADAEALKAELQTRTCGDAQARLLQELRRELVRLEHRLQAALAREQLTQATLEEARRELRSHRFPTAVNAERCEQTPDAVPMLRLQRILCVGGRHGSLAHYRQTVEQTGAEFLYHDGGLEQNPHALEAGLSAADLVICQTGCISHDAYWRVKDHCRRHNKQCLYVDNPSKTAIARELVKFARVTALPEDR